jgi:hypothetical protein
MAARLGQVIYWACTIIAALILVGVAFVFWRATKLDAVMFVLVFGILSAVVVWLIGRAAKYVLAGT